MTWRFWLTVAAMLMVPTAQAATRASLVISTGALADSLLEPSLVIIHVARDDGAYRRAHIPNARFLPLSAVAVTRGEQENELPPVADLVAALTKLGVGEAGRIVVYGDNRGLSAARVVVALDYLGLGDRAAWLDGGLEAWQAAKLPVTDAVVTPRPAGFTPRLRPEVLVAMPQVADASWLLTQPASSAVRIIDARPLRQYTGEEAGHNVPRPGHIPGSWQLYWETQLRGPADSRLKPAAELRAMYEQLGVKPGDTLISSCRTGMQASVNYLVQRYLGYDARLYDGSFGEWSRTAGLPVATGP